MDLNKEQNKALEDIYEIAREYGKISTYLNEMVDNIKLENGDNIDAKFMEMFTRHQVCHMKDYILTHHYEIYTRTFGRLDNVNTAFVNKD